MTDLTPAQHAYRALDFITANPQLWDQAHWCGTSMCIAGWIVTLNGDRYTYAGQLLNGSGADIEDRATELLGAQWPQDLDNPEIGRFLFESANTLEDLTAIISYLFGPRPANVPAPPNQYRAPIVVEV